MDTILLGPQEPAHSICTLDPGAETLRLCGFLEALGLR